MKSSGESAPRAGTHLAIDAVGMRPDSGGAIVLSDLLRATTDEPAIARTTVLAGAELAASLAAARSARQQVLASAVSGRPELLWWNLRGLEERATRLGADVILSLNGMGRSRSHPLFVLFQQQLMFAPEARARMGLRFRVRLPLMTLLSAQACRSARLVFTQGEHVSENVVRRFGVPERRVVCVPPDVTWPDAPSEPTVRQPGLLAYVGSDQPHKSLETLLEGFAKLRGQWPELELALTVGREAATSAPGILALGRQTRAEVRALLGRAAVLVMPSLAETVGLPLLEALDVGCNVVAADLPYAREVCGDAALYFRPGSPADCAEKVGALLGDAALQNALRERGRLRLAERRARRPYRQLLRQLLQNLA